MSARNMMSDDTTRRERAEKYLNGPDPINFEDSRWARNLAGSCDDDYGVLVGYLAGAREESAINSAEIAKLQEAVRLVESALMLDLMQSGESVTAELLAINWIERPEVQRAIGAGQ